MKTEEHPMKRMLILVALLAVACTAPTQTPVTETAPREPAAPQAAIQAQERPMSYYENKIAEIETTTGTIAVRFFPQVAPNHVKNFIDLSEQGFYDGTRFHRVIPGFMIQGGDPNTKTDDSATWGTGGSGERIRAEFNPIPHRRGILSMARSQHPDSASSQFFIVVADSRFLDNNYTVFGEVVSGMEVADAIVAAPRRGETPVNPPAIQRITIREATGAERGPIPQ
jgi:peptidyl-prolyl cis-trans isomerase B (cyclophilin B)